MRNITEVGSQAFDKEIVIEAHHRVKNTLQNIISYVNVMFAAREQVSREELHKLTRYVHSLSLIHDVLLEEVKNSGNSKEVRIDRVVSDLIDLYSVEMELSVSEIPACRSTTRRAATIALILNELIDNGKRYSPGATRVECKPVDAKFLEISVSSPVAPGVTQSEVTQGNGLRIGSLLARKDLESEVSVVIDRGHFVARFTAPVEFL